MGKEQFEWQKNMGARRVFWPFEACNRAHEGSDTGAGAKGAKRALYAREKGKSSCPVKSSCLVEGNSWVFDEGRSAQLLAPALSCKRLIAADIQR